MIGTLVGLIAGEFKRHLDPLLARLAEVEDAADAGLQASVADGVDRAQPPVVANGRRHLGVVRGGGLHVVVHALDPGLLERLRPVGREVADRDAPLEVRVLGDETSAGQHLLEVTLRQSLALGHHAEAMGPGGLGGAGVLKDLVGLHHRVHRRVGVRVLRLGAEAAVLGASAGLGVDERAHVGRVGKPLDTHRPGALDEGRDLGVIFEFAEA